MTRLGLLVAFVVLTPAVSRAQTPTVPAAPTVVVRGDDTRRWGPPFLGDESAYFLSVNRNKESVAIDFKSPGGREVVERLLAKADVVVENFRPGTLDALGLDAASVRARHPKIVYCSISGYGQTGPRREEPGYDAVMQAEGGLMSITGAADGLKRRADELVSRKRALKAGPKTKEAVDKILESIAKVKDHHLLGSNNPMVKARADYGVAMHKSLQGSCHASEIQISGDYCKNPYSGRYDCKIDCVIDCRVIEIKPKGAVDLGWSQAQAYVQGLREMYKAKGRAMFEGAFARFEKCLTSD